MRDPLPAPLPLVQSTARIASTLSLQTLPLHVHEILPSFCLYTFVNLALSPYLSRKLCPKTYLSLSDRSRVNWNTRIVSLVQSCFINGAAVWVISKDIKRWNFGSKERIWGYTGAGGMVQGFSAGYFLWDFIVSAVNMHVHGLGALAHASCALAVSMLGFRPFCNYYGVNLVLYELSTPFLQIHWFLDKFGKTGSRAQWINGVVLITTFGCSRLLWGTYQTVRMFRDMWKAHNMPGGLPIPPWLALTYVISNTALCGLNYWWFTRMIKAMAFRFSHGNDRSRKDH